MTPAENLAAEIRAAITAGTLEAVLAAHLADPVSVHHDPPVPTDGPISREAFAAILVGNPMAAMVPDGIRTYGATSVNGDTVSFESTLIGTTTTGEPICVTNRTVVSLHDDLITKLVQHYQPAALQALRKLGAATAREAR
jgi:hypothetical protein